MLIKGLQYVSDLLSVETPLREGPRHTGDFRHSFALCVHC